MKGPAKDPVLGIALRVALAFVIGDVLLDLLLSVYALSHPETSSAIVAFAQAAKDVALGIAAGALLYLLLRREAGERAAFEAALRESEERYRLLFESSIDGILLTAPDGSILAANAAACKMFGRSEAEICQGGRSMLVDLTDPRLPEILRERAATGKATGELRHVRKDGTTFPTEISSALFLDREGNTRTSMVIRDITKRQAALDALAASEERLRMLVTGVPAILWTTDADLRYTSVQGAGLAALETSAGAFLGSRVAAVQPGTPEEVHLVTEMHRRALAGESVHYETSWRGRYFESHVEPLHDAGGAMVGCIGVSLDITDRKQAEEALRASELRFRTVFEGAPIAIALETADGQVIEANPALAEMLGYSRSELLTLQHQDFTALDAEEVPATRNGVVQEPDRTRQGRDRRFARKDGQMRWGRVTTAQAPSGPGQPSYTIRMAEDITAQVEAYRLLEQRVAERTRELEGLLEISQTIASTLDPDAILGLALDQLKRMVDYTSASLFTCEDGDTLVMQAFRGVGAAEPAAQFRIVLTDPELKWAVLQQAQPLVIADLGENSPMANRARQAIDERLLVSAGGVRSVMWIPLIMKHDVIGGMGVTHTTPGFFDERQARLAQSIANQAAGAIANARLFGQAQQLATLEERQRLARELHDSLTQSLYSLTLLAEAANRQAATGNEDMVRGYVQRIAQTALQSLKEMRLLVYELQPATMDEDGLIGALRRRLEAVEGHTNMSARLEIEGNLPRLPAEMEQGLYGIAQEALNNALKHAAATAITVRLRAGADCVELQVSDDGCGCEPHSAVRGGGMGFANMTERAQRLGGTLDFASQPGRGTTVTVTVPAPAGVER